MNALAKPRIRVTTDGQVRLADGNLVPIGQLQAAGMFGRGRDAARHDLPEFSGWNPSLNFAGTSIGREWDIITGRARDTDENNGWINGGIDRRVESVVGVNIRLSAQPVIELFGPSYDYDWRMKWTGDVQARFKVWGNDLERRCDSRQMLSFGALAKLAYLTYVRDGEAAGEIRDYKRGLKNTTSILLIEPERISTPDYLTESMALRNGIRFDPVSGAVLGGYVRNGHPNDPLASMESTRWSYVPARGRTGRAKFIRVFSPRRVEQNRGVSKLAEVMLPAKMLDRVDRAEVNAALKAAIFSLFIKSPGTTDDLEPALAPIDDNTSIDPWIQTYIDYRGQNPVWIDGAQVTHLLPDEEAQFPDAAHPNSNYPDFARFVLQKVAGSLGISYPQLSQDYANINYSSARALLNEIWRSFLEDRWFFTQQFLTPVYAAWLEVEVANGDIKIPGGPANFYRQKTAICMAEWIGPGRGSVDPKKEADADNLDTAAGRQSTVENIMERGRDPSDVLSEEAWYLAERERRGLPAPNHNVKADAATAEDVQGAVSEAVGNG